MPLAVVPSHTFPVAHGLLVASVTPRDALQTERTETQGVSLMFKRIKRRIVPVLLTTTCLVMLPFFTRPCVPGERGETPSLIVEEV